MRLCGSRTLVKFATWLQLLSFTGCGGGSGSGSQTTPSSAASVKPCVLFLHFEPPLHSGCSVAVTVDGVVDPNVYTSGVQMTFRCSDIAAFAAVQAPATAVWTGACSGPALNRPCVLNPVGDHQNIGLTTSPATSLTLDCSGNH